jgi:hypothetical protein
MPASFVDEIEARTPGWITQRLANRSSYIESRLRKRYDIPQQAPYPLIVIDWLVNIVTYEAWLKRGVAATDEQFQEYVKRAAAAETDLTEAANSETGLFDLPLKQDALIGSGVTQGFPRGYSEASPYGWADEQACRGRQEDYNRG